MLRIDRTNNILIPLDRPSLRKSELLERQHIQQMIRSSPEAFCQELGEPIWFVGEEVMPETAVRDRIDLLGVDPDGIAVIIEIKRESYKFQLAQALSYAGMIAKWNPKRFIEELRRFNGSNQSFEEAKEELEEELDEGDYESINRSQRIVLLGEDFEFEVLVTAQWLWEHYEVDIRCYRLSLAKQGNDEFLSFNRVYPPPELTDIARRRIGAGADEEIKWKDWESALAGVAPAVRTFFESELAENRPNRLKNRFLRFKLDGKSRMRAYVRPNFAYVWQVGRFEGDVEYWVQKLGDDANVKVTTRGRRLSFRLRTEPNFLAFKEAWNKEIPTKSFTSDLRSGASGDIDEAESEE